jgi:hypothetical protein
MIQQDTAKIIHDSTSVLASDSIFRIDSLAKLDSIHLIDSLKSIVHIPEGFKGIPLPSMPQTEDWVFGTVIVLFILIVIAISSSKDMLFETIKTFFQVKERTSMFTKSTINDFQFRFFSIIFSIGVFSLYAFSYFKLPVVDFSFHKFLLFLLATTVFFGFKLVAFNVLGFVFLDIGSLKIGKESYFNIVTFFSIVLFPILIFQLYIPLKYVQIIENISLFLSVSTCVIVTIKLFQIFFHKKASSFYIFLYLCTLEFLPLVALYWVYRYIM